MAENCYKCKKAINVKEQKLSCATEDCSKKCHRQCANIDEAVFEVIGKNTLVKFNCGECNDRYKVLLGKMHNMEEKMNRLCLGMSQLQARMFQQLCQQGGGNMGMPHHMSNSMDGKKGGNHNNNSNPGNGLMVVGCNVTTDRLKVVCDFGRWVQVGKFATSTTEEDIIDYLAEELKINKNLVKCTKLVKNDANLAQLSYCKFKISIPDHRFNDLFNEAVWPSGVMVSPFTPRSQLNQNRI